MIMRLPIRIIQGCIPITYSVNWNGTNSNGAKVASGVYFVRMICEGIAKTVKLNVNR